MIEKLSAKEFFERASKGEFVGQEIEIHEKITTLVVEDSVMEGSAWGGEDVWYVGDEYNGLWSDSAQNVDYIIVKGK